MSAAADPRLSVDSLVSKRERSLASPVMTTECGSRSFPEQGLGITYIALPSCLHACTLYAWKYCLIEQVRGTEKAEGEIRKSGFFARRKRPGSPGSGRGCADAFPRCAPRLQPRQAGQARSSAVIGLCVPSQWMACGLAGPPGQSAQRPVAVDTT